MAPKRKITSKKVRQQIARVRFQKVKRNPIFFEGKHKNLFYFLEIGRILEVRYPRGSLEGSKIICNELMKSLLAKELSSGNSDYAKAKNLLLRIFERTYVPHGDSFELELHPSEKIFFKKMGTHWAEMLNRLSPGLQEIYIPLSSADATPERHYVLWTAIHLENMLTKIDVELKK